jgi:TrmH family RNA methyltransferase
MLSKNGLKYYSSLKQKKIRENEGKFLIEGFHLLEECLHSSYFLECVMVSESVGFEKNSKLLSELQEKKIPVYYLKESLFNKLADTENSQGIAAAVLTKQDKYYESLYTSKLIIALDRINDPGNMGTIIRTAYWFGVDSIVISEDSVDIYNPKVLRSTQGALFHVDIYNNVNLPRTLENLRKHGLAIYLLDAKAEKKISGVIPGEKTILVFGNEAEGISEDVLNKGFERVKIEGYTNCESLNVSAACAIALYEFTRKR